MTTRGASRREASEALRLVVFTAGPLTAIHRVFFERLIKDPLLTLSAIVVDETARPSEWPAVGVGQALRAGGIAGLAFTLRSAWEALLRKATVWLFERAHAPGAPHDSYAHLQRVTAVQIRRVPDIQSEASLAFIRSLRPHLGVIVGSPTLRDDALSIPEHGVLSLHKGTGARCGGGGPAGYWEILAGETSVDITVHHVAPRVGGGVTCAGGAKIPIEACDTLESLRIKADLVGARIYRDVIRDWARGMHRDVAPVPPGGPHNRAPDVVRVSRLAERLRRRAAAAMPMLKDRPGWLTTARQFLQYAALLPLLLTIRNRLTRQRLAPICILFYHVVANRPLNHLCLPLEEFVRQVEFLRRYYTLVALPEAVRRIRSGRNDRIAVSITFDDGYRDSVWALEYLRYFEIPACFFVSVGHIRDGTAFEHDRRRGFEAALPMSRAELKQLAADGFIVGSHGVYHEDFGRIPPATADRVLRDSREIITQICGDAPEHFSFPKGHLENMTDENFRLATTHYPYVYSAYGGYCVPCVGRRHFLRTGHPLSLLELAMVMDGYTGLRACLSGNAWGLRLDGVRADPLDAPAAVAAPVP